jgi:hypothetical protein
MKKKLDFNNLHARAKVLAQTLGTTTGEDAAALAILKVLLDLKTEVELLTIAELEVRLARAARSTL